MEAKSTIRLHMSRELLNELFPEGSEARIELTRNVAIELVKQLSIKEIKLLDDAVIAQISRVAEEQHKRGLEELGIILNYGMQPRLSEATAGVLKSMVGQAVSAQVYKSAEDNAPMLKEAAVGIMEQNAKKLLQGDLNALIDQRIRTILKGLA